MILEVINLIIQGGMLICAILGVFKFVFSKKFFYHCKKMEKFRSVPEFTSCNGKVKYYLKEQINLYLDKINEVGDIIVNSKYSQFSNDNDIKLLTQFFGQSGGRHIYRNIQSPEESLDVFLKDSYNLLTKSGQEVFNTLLKELK